MHRAITALLALALVYPANRTLFQKTTATTAEYKREGFDMPAMIARLHIKMERALYEKMDDK